MSSPRCFLWSRHVNLGEIDWRFESVRLLITFSCSTTCQESFKNSRWSSKSFSAYSATSPSVTNRSMILGFFPLLLKKITLCRSLSWFRFSALSILFQAYSFGVATVKLTNPYTNSHVRYCRHRSDSEP